MKLPDICRNRNRVLFVRSVGNLGDIFMHRMIFEDAKALGLDVHFACLKKYHPAVKDHPFIDKVLDSDTIDLHEYRIRYNTDTACVKYEEKIAPRADKHRSDIWAEHCGLHLTHHEMHFVLEDKEETEGREILSRIRHCDGPIVLIAPISTTTNMRALLPHQLSGLVRGLLDRGMCPVGLHSEPIPGIGVPVLDKLNIRQYMAVTAASDYVVSIDTGTFHCANGFHKPTLAIFTSADGFVYGKYFPEMELVQKHRSTDPQWTCGPCYTWPKCQKTKEPLKPCLTELTAEMMLAGWDKLVERYPK